MEDARLVSQLYDIIKQNKKEDYSRIIVEKASYPYLYHLSDIRQNLIEWFPITPEMQVLERNPECGALTGKLLEMAGEVTCVAEDEMHARLIEERCKENRGRLCTAMEQVWQHDAGETGRQGDLETRQYDVILLVGSFFRYKEELPGLHALLKEGGTLLVADANRLGLKYFAGCQEEYSGGYFTGVEGYGNPAAVGMPEPESACGNTGRCYTRREYTDILEQAGFCRLRFYYPYPDYKFPSCVYSDEWLPTEGELSANRTNYDRDRIELFDERRVYDTLLAEGLFGEFSNSFLIEAGK